MRAARPRQAPARERGHPLRRPYRRPSVDATFPSSPTNYSRTSSAHPTGRASPVSGPSGKVTLCAHYHIEKLIHGERQNKRTLEASAYTDEPALPRPRNARKILAATGTSLSPGRMAFAPGPPSPLRPRKTRTCAIARHTATSCAAAQCSFCDPLAPLDPVPPMLHTLLTGHHVFTLVATCSRIALLHGAVQ